MAARGRSGPSTGTPPGESRREPDDPADLLEPEGELIPGQKIYYRIGEVSKITGVKPYVLRYWESEFRWMAPQKSRSKQRLYKKKDIEMVLLIKKLLYQERYTIAGARRRLRELGIDKALEELQEAPPIDPRVELARVKEELLALRAAL